ncbi:TetR family transcriptional regulator [Niveispirillum sp. SYP-B3756]|uniref:TetR/AcrR family transcriptional regulator n=1 Tax=Niveispirillum sp. SYP-B3756 TaxID=2662178 RepID=UPI0012913B63|nr:TetR/AcrR family transcriptional regulator [Niveispirillum sp. SYP-B3756]MQP66243.1 TetR family transcriptional regulator [Niveispirillum sp. SYP-B3756]
MSLAPTAAAAGEGSRPARGNATREAIMAAAITVLARDGVQGTTTRRIAQEAGINLGTLHYHFDGKEAVLLSVLSHLLARVQQELATRFTQPEPLRDRIDSLIMFIRSQVEQRPDEQVALFNLTLYALATDGSQWLAKKKYEEFLALYRQTLAEASDVRDGSLNPDLDGLANFILTGLVGILLQWLATANGLRSHQAVRMLVQAAQQLYLPSHGDRA